MYIFQSAVEKHIMIIRALLQNDQQQLDMVTKQILRNSLQEHRLLDNIRLENQ
jgi:hypothetical protein